MPYITHEYLSHLTELSKKATPGPWKTCIQSFENDDAVVTIEVPGTAFLIGSPENRNSEANAAFIAAAREAVPALISDWRELSAQLAQAQAERDAARFALCRAYQTMELPDGKHIVDRDWDLIEALIDSGIYDAALKDGKE